MNINEGVDFFKGTLNLALVPSCRWLTNLLQNKYAFKYVQTKLDLANFSLLK